MLEVVGTVRSRALRVLWLLEEMGVEYTFQNQFPRTDDVKNLNPLGKVPVLIDDGTVVTDSTAIVTYLADKFNKFTYPAGTLERAKQDSITFFLLDELDGCIWTAARHSFGLPEEYRIPEIRDSLIWEFKRSQKHFVQLLGDQPFLMGDEMTVPDIIATHCGNWAIGSDFPISEPAYRDYIDRMRARPAFKRAIEK